MNPTMKTLLGDWEEVYAILPLKKDTWMEDLPLFHEDTTYYQTFGNCPEGGYFVKGKSVWRVSRSLYQPFRVEKLKNKVFEFQAADEMKGKVARCRLVEVYSLSETRTIVDEHILWGNTIEMVKALRDGLSSRVDASYKDLCLGIILDHLCVLDKHLDLLPPDSCAGFKTILHDLKAANDDGEESEDSEMSDSEEEEVAVNREGEVFLVKDKSFVRAKALRTEDGDLIKYIPEQDDPLFAESQWKAYMSEHTSWTLDEAHTIYVRPGAGGKKWSKAEAKVFEMIQKLSQRGENPYVFRLMPTKA